MPSLGRSPGRERSRSSSAGRGTSLALVSATIAAVPGGDRVSPFSEFRMARERRVIVVTYPFLRLSEIGVKGVAKLCKYLPITAGVP